MAIGIQLWRQVIPLSSVCSYHLYFHCSYAIVINIAIMFHPIIIVFIHYNNIIVLSQFSLLWLSSTLLSLLLLSNSISIT